MDDEIKKIAYDVTDKIYEEIIRIPRSEYHKFIVNVGIGADGTPTKYIDKFAEDIAIDFIKKSKLNINILSEEAGFLDFDGDYTFILDPIDGTRNAIRGIPIYSISLGVGKNSISDVNFGIVKNIPTGDLFIAEKGNGAFLNNNQIKTPEIPDKEFIFSYNDFNIFKKVNYRFDKVRALGCASIEICMVAIGAIDIYAVCDEHLRITDIAASSLFIKEAGGALRNINGEDIDLNLNLDNRTSLIAACNIEIVNDFIKRFN